MSNLSDITSSNNLCHIGFVYIYLILVTWTEHVVKLMLVKILYMHSKNKTADILSLFLGVVLPDVSELYFLSS